MMNQRSKHERIEREGRVSLTDIIICQGIKLAASDPKKESQMEPVHFETLPAFKVMEMKYHGNNPNQEISRMWGKLNLLASEIPMVEQCTAYRVCLMLEGSPSEGVFEYVAGFKVEKYDHIPAGTVVINVPENRYAVFAHRGSLENLGQTYTGICNDWFPRSGYKPTGGYDMEVYTEKFNDFEPDSVFYIYEPVN